MVLLMTYHYSSASPQGGRSSAWWARCGRRQREVREGRQLQLDVIPRRSPSSKLVAPKKEFAAQLGPRAQVVGADRPRERAAGSPGARGGPLPDQHRPLDPFMRAGPSSVQRRCRRRRSTTNRPAAAGTPLVACRRAPGALPACVESIEIGAACRQKATWGWPLPSWRRQGEPRSPPMRELAFCAGRGRLALLLLLLLLLMLMLSRAPRPLSYLR